MSEIRTALYGLLSGDATLTGLLGETTGIYHGQAPTEATYPLVIFHKQAGSRVWTFAGQPMKPEVWLVKAVDRSGSAAVAEQIDARLEALLNDAALSIADHTLLHLRRYSDVDYREPDGPELYQHVGGLYRLTTEHD